MPREQFNLPFESRQPEGMPNIGDPLLEEKKKIALRYKIGNLDSLVKRGEEWYVGNMTLREWDETMNDGASSNDAWPNTGIRH